MKFCSECQSSAVWVRQAFNASEISFVMSATVTMLAQASQAPADVKSGMQATGFITQGFSILRKLLVAVPADVREKMLTFYREQGNLEFEMPDCSDSPTTVH